MRPQNQAEAQLLATESRWNIPEKKMAQILGLTNSQGRGDWTMFDNFLTALMRAHSLGERELNAERLGPYGKGKAQGKADYFCGVGRTMTPFMAVAVAFSLLQCTRFRLRSRLGSHLL